MKLTKTPEEMAEEYASWVDAGSHAYKQGVHEGFLAGYQAAKDQLADSDKVMPQWISVKERLPEIDEWVLIDGPDVCKRIEPPSSHWKESYAWETNHNSFYSPNDVTHWMPLPDAPKEEK